MVSEGTDLDIRPGLGDHVGDLLDAVAEALDSFMRIDAVRQLRREIDPAMRRCRIVLDVIAEDLAVTDIVDYVVRRQDGRREQTDLVDGPGDSTCGDKVAHLEWP